eukprot:gene1600-1940_t
MVAVKIAQSDFSSSYGNKRLSDVTLVMYEEPGPDEQSVGIMRSASAVSEELPGHGVVLISASEYCRTAQQLLQVLLLADRYEVTKLLAAVSTAVQSIPSAELQWDTAMAIYNLPPGCAELEACENLYTAAAAKVQQQLGDLELVWHDQEDALKRQQLLGLPHQALKQLLESPLTAVHSENTEFIDWKVPMSEVQQLVTDYLKDAVARLVLSGTSVSNVGLRGLSALSSLSS